MITSCKAMDPRPSTSRQLLRLTAMMLAMFMPVNGINQSTLKPIQPAAPSARTHHFADNKDNNKQRQFQYFDEDGNPSGSKEYATKTEVRKLYNPTPHELMGGCQTGIYSEQADIKLQMVNGYWTAPDGEQGWELFEAAKSGKYMRRGNWIGVDEYHRWWVRISAIKGVVSLSKDRPRGVEWEYDNEENAEIQLVYEGDLANETCCLERLMFGFPYATVQDVAYFHGPATDPEMLEHRNRPRKSGVERSPADQNVYATLDAEYSNFLDTQRIEMEAAKREAKKAKARKAKARKERRGYCC